MNGALNAEAYVNAPRNNPAANVVPPRSSTRNGATGKSWNAERKTVKLNPHMTRKRGVKSGARTVDISTGPV